jgi:6-phospho-3-hexuloisomerase
MPDRRALEIAGKELLERIQKTMAAVRWESFMELGLMLPKARRTFVAGAGRSGLVARSFGMRLMHTGLPVFIPGETNTPGAGPGDLVVAISCTGQTGYTTYIAERARELGAKVAVVTSDAESPAAGFGDTVIIVPVEAEDIVIKAAVFEHATSLCLDAVFNVLADRLKLDLHAYRQRHANLE